MTWARRMLVALPLALAFILNTLMVAAIHLGWYRERIAGYGFLFATPWLWAFDPVCFRNGNRLLGPFIGYAVVLWIPAVLYSGYLWLFLVTIKGIAARLASTPANPPVS
jgi:hypothetical protein